jgi:hypothetical protein
VVTIHAAANSKENLPGDNVSISVYDPADGHFYALKGASGSLGIPMYSPTSSGNDYMGNAVTVTNTAQQLATDYPGRTEICIQASLTSTGIGYLGAANTVTSTGATIGFELVPGSMLCMTSADEWWGISAATSTFIVREVR